MKRVLVGTDGSVSGQLAVRWAVELARETGAKLLVATVWLPSFADVSPEIHAELRDDASRVLDREWCAPVRDAGVPFEEVLLEGDPSKALLHTADERDVDLIVVGTRGHGGFSGLRLGSTALKVVHHSGLPVVLVPSHDD